MSNPYVPSVSAPLRRETRVYKEIVVEPSWEVGLMETEGGALPLVSLYHPRHGNLTFRFSREQWGAFQTAVRRAAP